MQALSSTRSLQIAFVTAHGRRTFPIAQKPRPNARARSGSEISWRVQCEYSAERLSDQFETRRPVPASRQFAPPQHRIRIGHLSDASDASSPCQGQNWNNQKQARLVLVVETTNEQSISFSFERLDIFVIAPGEPVTGIGWGARHARQSG
jgi:hypothetical protein